MLWESLPYDPPFHKVNNHPTISLSPEPNLTTFYQFSALQGYLYFQTFVSADVIN